MGPRGREGRLLAGGRGEALGRGGLKEGWDGTVQRLVGSQWGAASWKLSGLPEGRLGDSRRCGPGAGQSPEDGESERHDPVQRARGTHLVKVPMRLGGATRGLWK